MMVIGIGNEFRHDDAVGLVAVRRLRQLGIHAEEVEPDAAALIDRWNGADGVVLVDAMSSGAAPGTIHRLDASTSAIPRELFRASTHTIGLPDAIEMSRLIGTLPTRVLVLGIEGEDFSPGIGLSQSVETALAILIESILPEKIG